MDSILKTERNVKYLKISSVYQTCAESESILKLRAIFNILTKSMIIRTQSKKSNPTNPFPNSLKIARNFRIMSCLDAKPRALKAKTSLTKGKKKLKKLEKFNNLESLSIKYCDERISLRVYMMLKKNVLLDVSIGGPFRPDYIDFLVDNQSTLKKLTVADTNLNSTINLMNHKQFTAFHIKAQCFYVCKPQDINDFLSNHPNLTSLDLESSEINFEVFEEICKLTKLEKLRVNIVKLCPQDMIQIASLTSLRELSIVNHSSFLSRNQFEAFTEIRNLKLTKFEMKQSSGSTERDMIRLAENNPDLEYVSIPCISKKVTEVFFGKCKMLKVFICPGYYQSPCKYTNTTFSSEEVDNMCNTNLIELDSPYFKPCNDLYKNFPNLRKFKWYPLVVPSDEDFKMLLIHPNRY